MKNGHIIALILLQLAVVVICQHKESESEPFVPVMVVEIYKPGSSTPVYGNPFNRDYIKVRGNKSLTEFGMRQHLNLGVDVRKIYKQLFKSIASPRDVKVYSSSSNASVMSATSHNIGMFKRSKSDRHLDMVFKRRHAKPLWFEETETKKELTDFEREQMTVPLDIREPRFDRMFFPKLYKVCPQAKSTLESIFEGLNKSFNDLGTPVYRELTKYGLDPGYFEADKVRTQLFHLQAKKKRAKTGDQVTKWNFRNAALWYDVLQSEINWYGYTMQQQIQEEWIEKLKIVNSAYEYGVMGTDEVRLLYTNEIAREIVKQITFHSDDALNTAKKSKTQTTNSFKFDLPPERVPLKYLGFSSGSFTLSAFLMAFDLVDSQCNLKKLMNTETKFESCATSPDPAASIRIEVTKQQKEGLQYPEFFVRTFYNGEKFKFCSTNEEYCPMGKFIDHFGARTITSHEATICGAEDALIAPNSHYFLIILVLICLIFWMRSKVVEDEEQYQILQK